MNIFAILGLMIDDLSTVAAQFLPWDGDTVQCTDDEAVRRYVEPIIGEHNTKNYIFFFGSKELSNQITLIEYTNSAGQIANCNVVDKIRSYVDHYGTSELYFRMCEEVLNLT